MTIATMDNSLAEPKYDARIDGEAVYVLPGYHHVSEVQHYAICTMLGSCVAACIWDPQLKIGGLNHFLLPEDPNATGAPSRRYGVYAMEVLINDILKRGSQKSDLVAKIFGGGNVISAQNSEGVGSKNVGFVRDFLRTESIPVVAEDVGGPNGRRIYFFPGEGRVSVLQISGAEKSKIKLEDNKLRERAVEVTRKSGAVELF